MTGGVGPGADDGPHVFVTDVEAPVLADDDAHHLGRVLRLRPGDRCTVGDGAGRWRRCRFGPTLVVDGPVEEVPAPSPTLTVAFALTKGDKPELVVQKLTELGVDRIVPFVGARSVVRWDAERAARNVVRWRRVAREAAMQSKRAHLPEVAGVVDFAAARALPGAAMADRDGAAPSLTHPTLLIGPEGGWSAEERAAGLPRVGLGPQILRSETAAVTAAALLAAVRAGLVRPE